MTNTRISAPVYDRLKERRDRLAEARDRQVTVTEVIEQLLDIAEAADAARQALGEHVSPVRVTEWAGPLP